MATTCCKPLEVPWRKGYIFRAILVRILFLIHSFLALMRNISVLQDDNYWLLSLVYVLVIAEGFYSIYVRHGIEHSWISLCILVYILTTIPSLWSLEVNEINTDSKNSTVSVFTPGLLNELGSAVQLRVNADTWLTIIQQTFLLVIILGRWLLPKGRVTHNELSQLLLIFIGKACDMNDFYQIFSENRVKQNKDLTIAILSIWTLSVFQFPFVLTATKSRHKNLINHQENANSNIHRLILETEIWSILINIFMQELPFMIIRWLVILKFRLLSYNILFFAVKNILLMIMYLYRLVSVCLHIREHTITLENNVQFTPVRTISGNNSAILDMTKGAIKNIATEQRNDVCAPTLREVDSPYNRNKNRETMKKDCDPVRQFSSTHW